MTTSDPKVGICNRFHIDEFNEYYSKFLSIQKENDFKSNKINALEKQIIILKDKIKSLESK